MEKDTVDNKRLSTSTSVSLSVANSASPSLVSETSNNNSILSKSPTPSSLSNYSGHGSNHIKESKFDNDKKKLKKVLHKFFKAKKIFNGSTGHHKKNSYSEKNVYGYPTTNGKSIPNANANLNKNANTISTSQPASLLFINNNQQQSTQKNIDNNYLTTPNDSSQLQLQLKLRQAIIFCLLYQYPHSSLFGQ